MKKIIIILTILLIGCSNKKIYINKFNEYNKLLLESSDKMFDLNNQDISLDEIKNSIQKYQIKDSWTISKSIINDIIENQNIDNIKIDIKKGLISKRGDLKGFPTLFEIYENGDTKYDMNQESELHVASPILILHESLDQKWVYIRCYNYEGWTLKDNVMYVDDNTFQQFLSPEKFIIITEPLLNIENQYLDMSVKLPLIYENTDDYKILMPLENQINKVSIPKTVSNKGYLIYEKDNVIKLAKKYLDTLYGWGGKNNRVDCSSYVANIFRTFGFYFPRNTREQRKIVGNKTDTTKMSEIEIRNILSNTSSPTLIYTSIHVLLYLYEENNEQYVIHASGNSGKVQIDKLSDVNGTNLYHEIISINEIKDLY